MDEIKELVIKHEREISQLVALQEVTTKQLNELSKTTKTISEAIIEIKGAIQQQHREMKEVINTKEQLIQLSNNILLEKEQQKETNKKIFQRIECLENGLQELKKDVKDLSESTTFARWLDGGFKVLSKKAAVFVLFILGLIILGAFLGIDLHHLIRKE